MKCTFQDCTGKVHGNRKYCGAHDRQRYLGQELKPIRPMRTGDDPASRIEGRYQVNATSGCHEWTGAAGALGYGRIRYKQKTYLATRFAYNALVGPIPDGLSVCHKCDNPKCINPEHLFLGTHKENMTDMANKKRLPDQRKTHCKHGHEFTPENTLIYPNRPNRRHCRECYKAHYARTNKLASEKRRSTKSHPR